MKKKLLIMLFCALALTGCKQKTIEEKTADLANLFIESLDSSTIDTGALEDEEISTYYEFINSQTEKSYIVNLTEIKIFDNAATTKDKDTGGIYEENGNLFIKYTDIPFIKDGEDFSAKLVYNGQETTIYKSLLPLLYINTSGIDKYKYEFMYHETFDEKIEYYYHSTYDDSGLIIRFYTENDKITNIYMIYEDKYSYEDKKEEVKKDYTKYYVIAGIVLVVIILFIIIIIMILNRKKNNMRGKLIIIEGTDCSGKETQSKMLTERLKTENIPVLELQYPRYDTPTGKIVGGPYLGKDYICDSYFEEGASEVPAKVASLYFAADRLYNKKEIDDALNKGINVILDRYVESNMAHQSGKLDTKAERLDMFKWLETLEFDMLGLNRPDAVIFLHMPYEQACILKKNRNENPDGHEKSPEHLKRAENTYLELSKLYSFITVKCNDGDEVRSKESIGEEVYNKVKQIINSEGK